MKYIKLFETNFEEYNNDDNEILSALKHMIYNIWIKELGIHLTDIEIYEMSGNYQIEVILGSIVDNTNYKHLRNFLDTLEMFNVEWYLIYEGSIQLNIHLKKIENSDQIEKLYKELETIQIANKYNL